MTVEVLTLTGQHKAHTGPQGTVTGEGRDPHGIAGHSHDSTGTLTGQQRTLSHDSTGTLMICCRLAY